jgi:hypothetical protein
MPEKKTENYSFRLTPTMKLDMLKRSGELGIQPGEYVTSLIEKDLASKANELPEREKTFLEKQFHEFAETLLSFFVDKFDKRLLNIESLSKLSTIIGRQTLYQSVQASERSRTAMVQTFITEARASKEAATTQEKQAHIDGIIKEKIISINSTIKKEMEAK